MAELVKFQNSEILYHIRHDLRELPSGHSHGNEAVDPELSSDNYSMLKGRCQTAEESNAYRKEIEKECFQYNRKNLVHAIEIIVQCPGDCPLEQKEAFFRESYNYICSTLPMGERCVFAAQVHVDEKHYTPSGAMISKDHLHVMYVPAVKDSRHIGYEYRLCADQLTRRAKLKEFHPGLQAHLDASGIQATVYRPKSGDGNREKTIALSVSQLKELTRKTGITIDRTLTLDQLASIITASRNHETQINHLQDTLATKQELIDSLKSDLKQALKENETLRSSLSHSEPKASDAKQRGWNVNQAVSSSRSFGWGHSSSWENPSSEWDRRKTEFYHEEDRSR